MIDKIVVEGPNNVGKSTFISKLKRLDEFKDWEVIHCTGDTPNTYEYFYELFTSNRKIIFDRAHVGERVYPIIETRQAKLTEREYIKLCLLDNVSYIFVDADTRFIKDAYCNKNETYVSEYIRNERAYFDIMRNGMKTYNDNVILINNF